MHTTEDSPAGQRVKRLSAAQQQASARQRHREQQQEKQRVFLVGKYALEKARGNATDWAALCQALDSVLVRKVDRGLFGLAPLLPMAEKGAQH